MMVEAIIDIPLPGAMLEEARASRQHLNQRAVGPRAENRPEEKAGHAEGAIKHFLAGPENCLLTVVVHSVLEERPNGYNPIVLYGPSGTGKSHLALGLAAAWKARNRRRVECPAAVDFARELAEAIETQALEEFRTKYRQAGMLVFEDIGRMVNRTSEKLSAEVEFIYALDALIDRQSWVIVTSSAAPGELKGILPTLQSRLMAGLTVPLAQPEADTRLAIINRLAQERKIDLPDPVVRALAEGFSGPVPELIGALTQLEVSTRREGGRIELKDVRALLAEHGKRQRPTIHAIALSAARHFGLKIAELRSPSRERAVVTARDAAVFLARTTIKCSFDKIGRYFGGRDHTTIMYSWQKMNNLLCVDPALRHEIEQIEREMQ